MLIELCFYAKSRQLPPLYSLHDHGKVFVFGLWRVSLAEYILVLRILLPCCFADGQMYYGYCILCLYPAMGDD